MRSGTMEFGNKMNRCDNVCLVDDQIEIIRRKSFSDTESGCLYYMQMKISSINTRTEGWREASAKIRTSHKIDTLRCSLVL